MKIDYPSFMLGNTLSARLHGTIYNYFISNMDEMKNALKVFPDFSLFHLLFSNELIMLALECKLHIKGLESLSQVSTAWTMVS